MKLQRKLTNKEWDEILALDAGLHMFRGKKTFIYNGKLLTGEGFEEYFIYNKEERQTWEAIIILYGVRVIPYNTFYDCIKVKTVIMADDSVRRIEWGAFSTCISLEFARLSRNLEYIGQSAFHCCYSLTSIFIPPSCLEIGRWAFQYCEKLVILHVQAYPFEVREDADGTNNDLNTWIKNINQAEASDLHRECASYYPREDTVYEILQRQGLRSFLHTENEIGVTASRSLQENPYSEIDEWKLINRYVLELMGEIIT